MRTEQLEFETLVRRLIWRLMLQQWTFFKICISELRRWEDLRWDLVRTLETNSGLGDTGLDTWGTEKAKITKIFYIWKLAFWPGLWLRIREMGRRGWWVCGTCGCPASLLWEVGTDVGKELEAERRARELLPSDFGLNCSRFCGTKPWKNWIFENDHWNRWYIKYTHN